MLMMRNIIIVFLLLINICGLHAQNNATVIKIVDADTYQVLNNAKVFTVRLANVDAPELSQQFGTEAKQFVSELIYGKQVLLDTHNKDRYNRTVASISIHGKALDSILISNGWAWYYEAYGHDKKLAAYQNEAIKFKLGLWHCGSNKVCPPWVFRSLNSKNRSVFCSGCKKVFVHN
jgi:micrococcal nuclease